MSEPIQDRLYWLWDTQRDYERESLELEQEDEADEWERQDARDRMWGEWSWGDRGQT